MPTGGWKRAPRAWRCAAWLAALGLVLGAARATAQADACSTCPEPTQGDVQAQAPELELEDRRGPFGFPTRDYLETDAGECTYALAGPPRITLGKTWLVLRGAGAVWNCPWGRSEDTITYEIESGDSSEWSLDASIGGEFKKAVFQLLFKADFKMAESSTLREVRKVTKQLDAAFGHVLDWSGYFELADVLADLDIGVTRRWSWWTKNAATGDEVHQSGSVWMDCGNEQAQLSRRASISYLIGLQDTPCDDPNAPPIDLGTFPRNPPPVVTPSDDPPVPGNHEEPGDEEQGEEPSGDEPAEERPLPDEAPDAPAAPGSTPPAEEPLEPPPAPLDPEEGLAPEEPLASAPTESGQLGDAPTGTLPEVPEGFGGPEAPGELPAAPVPTTDLAG